MVETTTLSRRRIRLVENFIDARLERRVNVAEIATHIGLSKSHFFRVFHRSFGITPHRYLMRRRVSLAQTLLTTTDTGLAEIALRAGFADQSHLARCFQRVIGLSPSAFRRHRRHPRPENFDAAKRTF